jgi:hypothetical protein
MDHDSDRDVAGAVRTLLVMATGDGPPETDLMDEVCRRVRRQRVRRRVLVPSLATLATASVLAVAALVASALTGTGTPSAQARVVAAAGRTATEGYRVRMVSTKSSKVPAPSSVTQTTEGVFDPAQRTGRLWNQDQGLEARFVGDMVYTELPAGLRSGGKRWLAKKRSADADQVLPAFVQLNNLAWQDPQRALAQLRSAAAVREQGRASGDGWSGRRYSFELDDEVKRGTRVTGTVDVDQAGRVRRLEVTDRLTTNAGRTPTATLHIIMEFRDYGAHEKVSAPPAGEVTRAPDMPSRTPSWRPAANEPAPP